MTVKFCTAHSMPFCRVCTKTTKPKFGTVRKPLKQSSERATRMSAEAEVQAEVGGRCILLGFMEGDCGVKLQRCHIVSQELLRETYKLGAWRYAGDEFWQPITRHTELGSHTEGYEQLALQQILDDSRNLVHGCEKHNVDGFVMVDALDLRRAANLPSYPPGFDAFTYEFRFSIEGSTFWYYQPFEGAGA